jgi:Mce-associated membrane protein
MAEHVGASDEELSQPDQPQTPADDFGHDGEGASESSAEVAEAQVDEGEDYEAATGDDAEDAADDAAPTREPITPVRLALALGLVTVVGLAALGGWLGFREHQIHQAQEQRELMIQVGRQGAVNLTTIDWQHADADIKRILDSATGGFYDDFAKRSKPFLDVVQKAQSKSVGTVTEAGLEAQSGDQAEVLVAVSVTTTSVAGPEPDPRRWRMRMFVQKIGNDAKISNVVFVP